MIRLTENYKVEYFNNDLTKNFDLHATEKVHTFHKSIPNYEPTPLIGLHGLANHLGIKKIWLKDESRRLDLNAFKVLGASYAVAKLFAEMFGVTDKELSYSIFTESSIKEKTKDLT